jgi:hypothetical protein
MVDGRRRAEMEQYHLNFSIPAPINPAGKPLSRLARDLEAEPLAEVWESGSIGEKASHSSSLVHMLVIIFVLAQMAAPLVDSIAKCDNLAFPGA